MKPILIAPLVAAALLLGVALTTLAADDAAAPAVAKPAQPWEHLALTHQAGENQGELAAKINKLGKEGWELVSVTEIDRELIRRTTYYFKRPL
jgi:hypothetical protein